MLPIIANTITYNANNSTSPSNRYRIHSKRVHFRIKRNIFFTIAVILNLVTFIIELKFKTIVIAFEKLGLSNFWLRTLFDFVLESKMIFI